MRREAHLQAVPDGGPPPAAGAARPLAEAPVSGVKDKDEGAK